MRLSFCEELMESPLYSKIGLTSYRSAPILTIASVASLVEIQIISF